jgi:hypothetical protein
LSWKMGSRTASDGFTSAVAFTIFTLTVLLASSGASAGAASTSNSVSASRPSEIGRGRHMGGSIRQEFKPDAG